MSTKEPRILALRYAAKAFLIIHHGGRLLPSEAKTFADLCCLAMPMKHRFNRQELDDIRASVNFALQEQLMNKYCTACGKIYKVFPEQQLCPNCGKETLQ